MLDDFVDVTKDEKRLMHLWNSFVRKQRSVTSGFLTSSTFTISSYDFPIGGISEMHQQGQKNYSYITSSV